MKNSKNSVKFTSIILMMTILLMSFKPQEEVILKAGTPIPLETINPISSASSFLGQTIEFRLPSDIIVDGKVVISAGSLAKGQVVRAQNKKGLGKPGIIEIQIKSINAVDGQNILIMGGNVFEEGDDKVTEAVLLGVLVCILFLTLKGTDATIPAGLQIYSSVATEYKINV